MDKTEFFNKRQKLFNLMNDNSMFILEAPKEGEDKYNPNRNFLYFTGIKESQDKLVLIKKDGKKFETLFIKPYDPIEEKWVGRGLNQEEAEAISGIRDIRYIDSFDSFVGSNLNIVNNLYMDFDRTDSSLYLSENEQKVNAIKQKYPYVNLLQGRTLIQHLRTIKSSAEIEEIKKAIHITRLGIEELMKNSKDGLYEYQLESYFDQTIKYNGANGYAFDTIAASGKNSCCLHYSANQDIMHNGDLILFDLGSTYNYYCSDISRTFPVNGKFTPRQRQIYEIVLNGQKLMFKNMKPGITQRELNQILVKYFQVELKKIGLIKDDSEVSKYYYHGVSHHMGLDCHDLADYTPLEAGAVISNEPGLYIPEENIGIRIEDDVLITEDGCINLSNEILKEPDEIEAFMAKYNKNI